MHPHSSVLATPVGTALHAPVAPVGNCVIGIQASNRSVDAAWLRPVILSLLGRHENVMILLTSELLAYAGTPGPASSGTPPTVTALHERVTEDTMARWLEIEAVKLSLKHADHARVFIAGWAYYTDAKFAELWRMLLAAFARDRGFRRDVLGLTLEPRTDSGSDDGSAPNDQAGALSRLECLAMRLRVCELGGYHNEYGFGDDEIITRRLYADAYAADGLSVEALVGHPSRRVYRSL